MFTKQRKQLVSSLKTEGIIKSQSVEKAFLDVPREKFVPKYLKIQAYRDTPLLIGSDQTISAPHMVAIMCEVLDLEEGQKVLEIGAGSGYHAAIVSKIVGNKGHVFSIERFESLAQKAKQNLKSAKINNVTVEIGDGSLGLEKYSSYDRIYVTCASPTLPPPLIKQTKENGKILIPLGDKYCVLRLFEKKGEEILQKDFGGCVFVPLIGKYGH